MGEHPSTGVIVSQDPFFPTVLIYYLRDQPCSAVFAEPSGLNSNNFETVK